MKINVGSRSARLKAELGDGGGDPGRGFGFPSANDGARGLEGIGRTVDECCAGFGGVGDPEELRGSSALNG